MPTTMKMFRRIGASVGNQKFRRTFSMPPNTAVTHVESTYGSMKAARISVRRLRRLSGSSAAGR